MPVHSGAPAEGLLIHSLRGDVLVRWHDAGGAERECLPLPERVFPFEPRLSSPPSMRGRRATPTRECPPWCDHQRGACTRGLWSTTSRTSWIGQCPLPRRAPLNPSSLATIIERANGTKPTSYRRSCARIIPLSFAVASQTSRPGRVDWVD